MPASKLNYQHTRKIEDLLECPWYLSAKAIDNYRLRTTQVSSRGHIGSNFVHYMNHFASKNP